MSAFGRAKESIFRDFLKLKHAIPSHDTVSTVFRMIDPKALDAAFGQVLADVTALAHARAMSSPSVARRCAAPRDKGESARTRMVVSAHASRLRLTLASATADTGAELEAAPEVRGLIALKGKVATADDEPCRAVAIVARTVAHRARTDGATMGNRDVGNSERQWRMHCNRRTVAAINAQGGDWCLALKANQESLLSDARACFSQMKKDHPVARFEATGHGRKESRTAVVVSAKGLAEHHEFPGLKAFGRIEAPAR